MMIQQISVWPQATGFTPHMKNNQLYSQVAPSRDQLDITVFAPSGDWLQLPQNGDPLSSINK